jgi:hypothetical protein
VLALSLMGLGIGLWLRGERHQLMAPAPVNEGYSSK